LSKFFQIKSYFTYWLEAVDSYSLHSPFFFDFYRNVVRTKKKPDFKRFEDLRKNLKRDTRTVTFQDFGAGSNHQKTSTRNIRNIARTSLSTPAYAAFYHRIINYYNAKNIIELGTSLGINTLYLADNPNAHVITFEGSKPIAEIARITFEFAQVNNITVIEGNIDQTLPLFIQTSKKLDVAFLDANHRYEPTRRYFNLILQKIHEHSIVIMDDIHYSKEMEQAWNEIKSHQLVYGSADLYRCGILFFDPSLNKQHVVLQFNN
jgi:predicted O-methyltransferase YrrM